jgi:PAS domain S-box-containing protein
MSTDERKTKAELLKELKEARQQLVRAEASGKNLKRVVKKAADFASFTELNPDPILELDQKGNIKYTNPITVRLFPDLPTLGNKHPFLKDWAQVVKEFESNNWDKTIIRNVAVERLVYEQVLYPVTENQIRIYGRNITRLKKAEQELFVQGQILTNLSEGINIVRFSDLDIIYTNPKFDGMFGYNRGELIGKHVSVLNAPGKPGIETAKQIKRHLSKNGEYHGETHNIHKDGSYFWCQVNVSKFIHPLYGTIAVSVHEDITKRRQAEEALKKTEKKYRHLAESISDVFFAMDKELRYTYWNKASEELTGIPAKDALGKSLIEVYPDNEATRAAKARYLKAMETRQSQHFTVEYPGEQNVIYEISAYPTEGGVSVFVKDITQRRRMEEELKESEERFKALVETTNDFIWEMNLDGVYTYCSPQMEKLWGLKPEEMLGKTPFDLVPPEDREQAIKVFSAASRCSSPLVNMEIRSFDGTGRIIFLEINSVPFLDIEGKQCGFRGITRDITERKKAEAKALEMEALKKINQAKSELLANVSHELRTPLASIKGNIETLLETDVKWSKKQQLEFLQAANRQADRLTLLIRDLLDMSRIDSGKLTLDKRSYPVSEILDSVSGVLSVIAEKHKLKIVQAPDLPTIRADKSRIGQVITNLVENATKFSAQGSPIVVEVKTLNENVIFSIEDRGIGITPEVVAKLFDMFYQAQEVVKGKIQGSGLGLPICRGILEGHGGKIWVESQPGKGSKFSFSIPAIVP